MINTTQNVAESILQKNLDYTLFSWSKQKGIDPINAHKARGVYLYDRSGNAYLDFSSQLMNVNIGHGNPSVARAVAKQMEQLNFVSPGAATQVRGELGEKLQSLTPGKLQKVLFTLGGAEAIDNAVKLARLYTGRHKVITQYRAYHGASIGAISTGGDPRKLLVDAQQVPNIIRVENPYTYRCPWYSANEVECGERAIANLEQVVRYEGPENVAAILMEGESGTSGCIKYPPMYLRKVKDICEKHGILFIADEIMSGFGRTGKWFGVDHHDVTPDIMCMAKGLTSGYIPLGGMMVTSEIADAFNDRYLPLGLTYSAHAVCCAAALAVIKVYEDQNLIQASAEKGSYMDEKMQSLKENHPCIGDWRNTGLLGCLEIVKNKESKEPMAPWNAKPEDMTVMSQVAARIKELGMFTFVKWNFIFITPPLIITKSEIDQGIEIISEALKIADAHCY